jgi:tetratricopeptide (TPR) repeat protein
MLFIKKILNLNNYIFISILLICIFLAANEFIKLKKINKINYQINNNELVINDQYEKISLYSSAYLLGQQGEYDNAIEKYNILLRLFPEANNIDIIYFNIGTLFLQDGLSKPLSDDGKLTVENFHKLQSAIISYEKALEVNPLNKLSKFNLSILYSSMPDKPSEIITDKAVQELSNIPIGLP